MKFYLDPEDEIEISPIEESDDKCIIKGSGPTKGIQYERRSEEIKEIIAEDALRVGVSEAAAIHGASVMATRNYMNGNNVSTETRTKIIAAKYEIENLATAKLMDTLNILDAKDLAKPRDRIALMTGLSQVVERMGGKERESGVRIQIVAYMPEQRKREDYDIIEA